MNLGNEFAFHNDFETDGQNTTEKSYRVFGRGKERLSQITNLESTSLI